MKILNSVAIALFIYANGAIAGVNSSFESFRAQSDRDSRVPVGIAWEERNAAEGGAKLTPIVNQCQKTAPGGMEDNFSMLVKLAKHGVPITVLVSPQNKFSECVRAGVANISFRDAPWEGYVLKIDMAK